VSNVNPIDDDAGEFEAGRGADSAEDWSSSVVSVVSASPWGLGKPSIKWAGLAVRVSRNEVQSGSEMVGFDQMGLNLCFCSPQLGPRHEKKAHAILLLGPWRGPDAPTKAQIESMAINSLP
jgi:hypothetical protein